MNNIAIQQAILSCIDVNDPLFSAHRQKMLDLVTSCLTLDEPCWGHTRTVAHFTASAFIVNSQGQFLAIFHKKLQRWLQPGGHIESEDLDPLHSALREACEEVGAISLTLLSPNPVDLDVHVIPAKETQEQHEHFDIRYAFLASDQEKVQINHESQAWQWLDQSALIQWTQDPSIARAVQHTQLLLSAQKQSH